MATHKHFHPSLLSLDNQMEEFWEEYRKKIHIVSPCRVCHMRDCDGNCLANSVQFEPVPPHRELEQPRITFAEEIPVADKWWKSWLKVAKGIIG